MKPENTKAVIDQCRRCGTCCRKGGPALHLEDQVLVESGRIALKDLFTIRKGEPVYDNVTGVIQPAASDIIKIAFKPGSDQACRFFSESPAACTIHAHRPVECRALKCWDPRPLMVLYHRRRLTRKHLLSKIDGLWGFVQDHRSRCDYGRIDALAGSLQKGQGEEGARKELLEMIRYDQSLRRATMERTGYEADMLLFLLGRPLVETIRLFRLRLAQRGGVPVLEPHI
jgi:Fe-S-cluster containining protein